MEVRGLATVVVIQGSPSSPSKTAAVVRVAEQMLRSGGVDTHRIDVRDLSPQALATADAAHVGIQAAVRRVLESDAVVVATPVYKAAYTGLLKLFLDLLPPRALEGKVVLPIATGGSPAHLLALDYALKPVLAALGAKVFVSSVYVLDASIELEDPSPLQGADRERLDRSVEELRQVLNLQQAAILG